MKEEWKDIIGYEGYYQVSNFGRVKSCERKRWNGHKMACVKETIVSGYTRKDNYIILTLSRNGQSKKEYLHRVVALAFLPTSNESLIINHMDGNPSNNNVNNLEWCTHSDNNTHAYQVLNRKHSKGMLGKLGSAHPNSKEVKQLKDGVLIGVYGSMREAERKTGISNSQISTACKTGKIANGFQWKLSIKK